MIALSVFAIGPSLIAGFIGYLVYLLFDLIAPQNGIITAITAIALLASGTAFCTVCSLFSKQKGRNDQSRTDILRSMAISSVIPFIACLLLVVPGFIEGNLKAAIGITATISEAITLLVACTAGRISPEERTQDAGRI